MSGYQAIVLAAGAGSRFGGGKLVAPWRGKPLVTWAVEAALDAPVDEVIVILGCDAELVANALPSQATARLRTVHAADWAEGVAASLRRGVASLPVDSAGFVLFLGDMPAIPPSLPAKVLDALTQGAPAVRPTRDGTPAHPVGFSSAFYPDLIALTGDTGANGLLRDRTDVVRLEVEDAGAVIDVDRPEDLLA